MKRLFQAGLAALGIRSPGANSVVLTPAQFTAEFVAHLQAMTPGIKVQILKDLELKLTSADGHTSSSFLNNAYDTYCSHPEHKADIIEKFAAAWCETASGMQKSDVLDRTRIIPVIKDRAWLEETHEALRSRGAEKIPDNVFENLNADLIVLYAEDSPKNIRYFCADDLVKADIKREELRSLACDNLKKLIPAPKRQGGNGVYMLTAGGDYEASLLLFDTIWTKMKPDVKGDVVVAIPTRDLLLVTGSEDSEGIKKLRQIVQQALAKGSYRLTPKLFVYRNGTFTEFKP